MTTIFVGRYFWNVGGEDCLLWGRIKGVFYLLTAINSNIKLTGYFLGLLDIILDKGRDGDDVPASRKGPNLHFVKLCLFSAEHQNKRRFPENELLSQENFHHHFGLKT